MASLNGLPEDVFQTPIHPAAFLCPELPADELKDLAADVKKNGLLQTIAVHKRMILDGRTRLKACKLAGVQPRFERVEMIDPFDFVLSCNLHRRHLTPAQRREVIAAVLKQRPEKSNRQVAEKTKSDHKTVGKVREQLEGRGEIPHVATRQDSKGRGQPAQRKTAGSDKQPSANGSAEKAKDGPKYPVSNAVERWLRTATAGFAEIEKEHGHFMKLANKSDGWNPQRRDSILAGLCYVQIVVNGLVQGLEPAKKKERTSEPLDQVFASLDSMLAKYTAKEREACNVLGIPWPPTQEALDTTFRRRAKTEHPDKGGNVAAFQKIVDAHECLEKYLLDLKQRR